nr:MAG TPA: hypothetical protein [Caudoviricetes sp.]
MLFFLSFNTSLILTYIIATSPSVFSVTDILQETLLYFNSLWC